MKISKSSNSAAEPSSIKSELLSISEIGTRLRQVRTMRKWSLSALAREAEISVGMLSHVERGQTYPSIQTLQRIVSCLGIEMADLFRKDAAESQDEANVVVRKANRLSLSFGSSGLSKELLSPTRASDLEMLVLKVPPGSDSGQAPWVRNSEKAGVVLSGRFDLMIGHSTYSLEEGDSFQFDGQEPHRFRNPGKATARILWIIRSDAIG